MLFKFVATYFEAQHKKIHFCSSLKKVKIVQDNLQFTVNELNRSCQCTITSKINGTAKGVRLSEKLQLTAAL